MRTIHLANVLCYYDGVQVFDARDAIGGHYLGLLVEDARAGAPKYLVVGVPPEDLSRFRLGEVDLRSLLENRAEEEWFTVETTGDPDQPLPLQGHEGTIPESYFPQPGFVLHGFGRVAEGASVLAEAHARRRVVVELRLETPEGAHGHKVRANTLSGLLIHLQSLLSHAYAKALSGLSSAQRAVLDTDTAPLLDVIVPAAPGSLRVLMEAAQQPDMFGYGQITEALAVVDEITAVAPDPDATLDRVRHYRGHTAGAYLRLLRFMVEARVSMQYAWASPDRSGVSGHAISRAEAEPLVSALTASESLRCETVTLVGQLRKVDVDAGTWRLRAAEDNKDYTGKVRPGASLSHLVIDEAYRFVCDEDIEEVTGMGREVKTLYLTSASGVADSGRSADPGE